MHKCDAGKFLGSTFSRPRAGPGFGRTRQGYVGPDMTQHTLTHLPVSPSDEAPVLALRPRGFHDCRGEWQTLDEDEALDAAS
jgi:hypothetical protein